MVLLCVLKALKRHCPFSWLGFLPHTLFEDFCLPSFPPHDCHYSWWCLTSTRMTHPASLALVCNCMKLFLPPTSAPHTHGESPVLAIPPLKSHSHYATSQIPPHLSSSLIPHTMYSFFDHLTIFKWSLSTIHHSSSVFMCLLLVEISWSITPRQPPSRNLTVSSSIIFTCQNSSLLEHKSAPKSLNTARKMHTGLTWWLLASKSWFQTPSEPPTAPNSLSTVPNDFAFHYLKPQLRPSLWVLALSSKTSFLWLFHLPPALSVSPFLLDHAHQHIDVLLWVLVCNITIFPESLTWL